MKLLPVIILLIFGITIRIFYSFTKPVPSVAPDTYGYYLIGQRILHGTVPFLNDERTPLYPLFLNTVMYASKSFDAPILSQKFYMGASAVIAVQALLGIIGYLLLFRMFCELSHSETFSFVLTLVLSFNHLHFGWERVLTAESVTFFWLALLFYVSMYYVKKPSPKILLMLVSLFIIGFLLKPLFIGLPFLVIPIITWHRGITKMALISSLTLLVYSSIPLAYINTNIHRKNYNGINHVSDVNLLGKIFQYRIPVVLSMRHSTLTQAIQRYQQLNLVPDPYAFLSWYEPNLLTVDTTKRSLNELHDVALTTIQSNRLSYMTNSLVQIPQILASSPVSYVSVSPGENGYAIWNMLQMLFRYVQYSSFLMIACFLHSLFLFVKNNGKQSALMLIISITFFYQLTMVALFAFTAEEYGRLMSPTMPFASGFIACWIYRRLVVLSRI